MKFSRLPCLECLDLIDNKRMSAMQAGCFNGIRRLAQVHLKGNRSCFNGRITADFFVSVGIRFTALAVEEQDVLRQKDMVERGCEIDEWMEKWSEFFWTYGSGTTLLLDLRSCDIEALEPGCFNGQAGLRELCLDRNPLSAVPLLKAPLLKQ